MTTNRTRIGPPSLTVRSRHDRDAAWLRRARRKYAIAVRAWVELAPDPREFRARLYYVAERAQGRGLYAASTGARDLMYGLLSQWRRSDEVPWWPWMHADRRRASVAERNYRVASIKADAAKLRGVA